MPNWLSCIVGKVMMTAMGTDAAVWLARLLVRLPVPMITALGRGLGWLFWWFPNRRQAIARRNLDLCFPAWDRTRRDACLQANMVSTGQAVVEAMLTWWRRDERWLQRVNIQGFENLERALRAGQAPLLLSCHLHAMELGGRAINRLLGERGLPAGHVLARQHNNKRLEAHIDAGRRAFAGTTIDKKDMKQVLCSLRAGHPVFMAPDQNFSYQCVYAPFFGVPAATVTAPARLARRFSVPVLPFFTWRSARNRWHVRIYPPADFFHREKDPVAVATKMNRLFERAIAQRPEQYLWVHRRFKNHPDGKNAMYRHLSVS